MGSPRISVIHSLLSCEGVFDEYSTHTGWIDPFRRHSPSTEPPRLVGARAETHTPPGRLSVYKSLAGYCDTSSLETCRQTAGIDSQRRLRFERAL